MAIHWTPCQGVSGDPSGSPASATASSVARPDGAVVALSPGTGGPRCRRRATTRAVAAIAAAKSRGSLHTRPSGWPRNSISWYADDAHWPAPPPRARFSGRRLHRLDARFTPRSRARSTRLAGAVQAATAAARPHSMSSGWATITVRVAIRPGTRPTPSRRTASTHHAVRCPARLPPLLALRRLARLARSRGSHGEAAVDDERLPIHVGGLVRQQEDTAYAVPTDSLTAERRRPPPATAVRGTPPAPAACPSAPAPRRWPRIRRVPPAADRRIRRRAGLRRVVRRTRLPGVMPATDDEDDRGAVVEPRQGGVAVEHGPAVDGHDLSHSSGRRTRAPPGPDTDVVDDAVEAAQRRSSAEPRRPRRPQATSAVRSTPCAGVHHAAAAARASSRSRRPRRRPPWHRHRRRPAVAHRRIVDAVVVFAGADDEDAPPPPAVPPRERPPRVDSADRALTAPSPAPRRTCAGTATPSCRSRSSS